MLTAMIVLAIVAFVAAVVSAAGYCPLWVSVMLLCVIELLHALPIK